MTSDDAFMALAGVRYCLGRHSYAPGLCCDWLKRRWSTFADGDRSVILRDIREHIADEERRKADRETVFAIDVHTWREFVSWVASLASQPADQTRQGEP